MENNKIQFLLCSIISVLCWSNVFGQSDCGYVIEVSAEPTTLYVNIYNSTDFGPYTPDVVEWYSPGWGINFGDSATVVYELSPNFPPSFEMVVCADYQINNEWCTACDSIFVADVNPCEYELNFDVDSSSVSGVLINAFSGLVPDDVTWILEGGGGAISNDTILFYQFDEPGDYIICAEYEDTDWSCEGVICDTVFVEITNEYLCDDIDLAFEMTPQGSTFTTTHLLFYEIADSDVEWYINGEFAASGNPISYDSLFYYSYGFEVCAVVPAVNTNTGETCVGEVCEWIDVSMGCPEVEILYEILNDSTGIFGAVASAPFEVMDSIWVVNDQVIFGNNDFLNTFPLQQGHNTVCFNGVAINTTGYDPVICPVNACTEIYIATDTTCNYDLEILTFEDLEVLGYVYNDITGTAPQQTTWTVDSDSTTIIYGDTSGVVIQFEEAGTYTICAEYYDPITECGGTLCDVVTVTGSNNNDCEGFDFEYEVEGNWAIFEAFYYIDIYEVDNDSIAWFIDGQFIEYGNPMDYNFPALGGTFTVCAEIPAFNLVTQEWCDIEVCHEVSTYCPPLPILSEQLNDSLYVFSAPVDIEPFELDNITWYINNYTSQDSILTYAFPESGIYYVCVSASLVAPNGNWVCGTENCIEVEVEMESQQNDCEAFFTWQDNGSPGGALNSVSFNNLSTGNYTNLEWNFGDGSTGSPTEQSFVHFYENVGVYNVCLTVFDNSCQDTHCEIVLVSGTPTTECDYEIQYGSPIDNIFFFILTSPDGISGNPEWFNLNTNEIYGTGDSIIIALDDYGVHEICASYETVGNTCFGTVCTSVTVENTDCEDTDCVFPGDADYNMIADNYDVLPIGLHFGETGPLRPDASIDWYGQPAPDWQMTADSINLKHVDTNGDGEIFFDDIDAIEQNYNRTHDGVNVMRVEGAPGLHLEFDLDTIYSTPDTGNIIINADIILGTMDLPVEEIYGVAFSVGYPVDLVDSSSVTADYFMESWIGDPTTILQFEKNVFDESVVDFAYSRTDQQNISGFGQIGEVSFVMTDNIIGKLSSEMELHFPITNVRAILNTGEEIVITGGENVVTIDLNDQTTAVENPDLSQYINIFPNPTPNTINMTISDLQAHHAILYNTVGQRVLARQIVSTNTQIDVSQLPSGVYLLSIQTDKGIHSQKIIIE